MYLPKLQQDKLDDTIIKGLEQLHHKKYPDRSKETEGYEIDVINTFISLLILVSKRMI